MKQYQLNHQLTHQFNVRLNDTEYNLLRHAHGQFGVSKSQLIRTLIYFFVNANIGQRLFLKAIKSNEKHDGKANALFNESAKVTTALNNGSDQVRRVGNNLNQLVKSIHSGDYQAPSGTEMIAMQSADDVRTYYLKIKRERERLDDAVQAIKKESD